MPRGSWLLLLWISVIILIDVTNANYVSTTLVALIVGDGITCPSDQLSCTAAAPVYLMDINISTTTNNVTIGRTRSIGITLSANDYSLGTLNRCTDGTCLTFTGINTTVGTLPGTSIPYFNGANRIVGRLSSNGNLDFSTRIPSSFYDGIPKAVCSVDGTRYWIAGNATNKTLVTAANGRGDQAVTVYTGTGKEIVDCQAFTTKPSLCILLNDPRNDSSSTFEIQHVNQDLSSLTSPLRNFTIGPQYTDDDNGVVAKQILLNKLRTKVWITDMRIPRLFFGWLTNTTLTVIPNVAPIAIALSHDESRLYFVTRTALGFYAPADSYDGTVTILHSSPLSSMVGTNYQFRGLAFAPLRCNGGSSSLFSGEPGWYCDGYSQLQCPVGTYSTRITIPGGWKEPDWEMSTCADCPIGTYASTVGNSQCTVCPKGSYSSTTGASRCTLARPGTYVDTVNSANFKSCPVGHELPYEGGTSINNCTLCGQGTYNDSPGRGYCLSCPPGTYSDAIGLNSSSLCKYCNPGTFSTAFFATSASVCLDCPFGTYSGVGQSSCYVCPAGYHAYRSNDANCFSRCPQGWFCDGINPPQPCRAGSYGTYTGASNPGDCSVCGPGTYSLDGQSSCTLCPAGFYTPFSNTTSLQGCFPCQAGYFAPNNGTRSCTPCPRGRFSTQVAANSSTMCQVCPGGTASNVTGTNSSDTCQVCPLGTYALPGSGTCSICERGTFTNRSGTVLCSRCNAGYHSDPGATECTRVTILADHLRSSTDGGGGLALPFRGPGVGTGDGRAFIAGIFLDIPIKYVPFGLDANGTMYLAPVGETPGTFSTGNVYRITVNGTLFPGRQTPLSLSPDARPGFRQPLVPTIPTPYTGSIALAPDGQSFVSLEEISYTERINPCANYYLDRNRKRIRLIHWPSYNETGIDMYEITPQIQNLLYMYAGCGSTSIDDESNLKAVGLLTAPRAGITIVALQYTYSFAKTRGCSPNERTIWSSETRYISSIVNVTKRTGYAVEGLTVAVRKDGILVLLKEENRDRLDIPANKWYSDYYCSLLLYNPFTQDSITLVEHHAETSAIVYCDYKVYYRQGTCFTSFTATFDTNDNLNVSQTGSIRSTWTNLNYFLNTSGWGKDSTEYAITVVMNSSLIVGPSKFIIPVPPSFTLHVKFGGIGTVLGIHAQTGTTVWSFDLFACVTDIRCPAPCTLENSGKCVNPLGTSASFADMLVGNDGTVYVLLNGVIQSVLFTFDGNTGSLLWTYKGLTIERQPVGMMLAPDGTLYVTGGGLFALVPCPAGMMCNEFVEAVKCEPGFFNPDVGKSACEACSAGTYSRNRGQNQCTECPVGTYSTEIAATSVSSCMPCSAGYFQNRSGAPSSAWCTPCSKGRYSTVAGAGSSNVCLPCAAGFFGPSEGVAGCEPCGKGLYGSVSGGIDSTVCESCPIGTYNELEGQTRLGCIPCPKGRVSANTSATSKTSCLPCSEGYFAPEGSSVCEECSPGSFADRSEMERCTLCPKNTYNPKRGSVRADDCLPCPVGTSTAVAGSVLIDDCTTVTFTCPLGTQSKAGTVPSTLQDCVPLACRPPLQPLTATGTIANSNASGSFCGGCPPGSVGRPGECGSLPCALDHGEFAAVCPGFLSIGLPTANALSLFATGYNGTWICSGSTIHVKDNRDPTNAKVSADWLKTSLVPMAATLTEDINGVIAGGIMIMVLSVCALLFLFQQQRRTKKKSKLLNSLSGGGNEEGTTNTVGPITGLVTKYVTKGLETIDAFALQHNLKRGQPVTREPTPLGGMCSILGYVTLLILAIILILRRNADNVLLQQSLSILDDQALASTTTLPWTVNEQAGIPGWTGTQGGLRLRILAAGDEGKACEVEDWSASGFAVGQFRYASEYRDRSCYNPSTFPSRPFISHLTWSCGDCLLTSYSSLTFTLPSTCQTVLLEAVGVAADGSVSVLSTGTNEGENSRTEIQRVIDNGPVESILWSVVPLLTVRRDERTGNQAKGYSLIDGGIEIRRKVPNIIAATGNAMNTSSGRSNLATVTVSSITVTVSMNLQSFYTLTVLNEKTSLLQLLANIAGFMGIFSVFGFLFKEVEARLVARKQKRVVLKSCGTKSATDEKGLASPAVPSTSSENDSIVSLFRKYTGNSNNNRSTTNPLSTVTPSTTTVVHSVIPYNGNNRNPGTMYQNNYSIIDKRSYHISSSSLTVRTGFEPSEVPHYDTPFFPDAERSRNILSSVPSSGILHTNIPNTTITMNPIHTLPPVVPILSTIDVNNGVITDNITRIPTINNVEASDRKNDVSIPPSSTVVHHPHTMVVENPTGMVNTAMQKDDQGKESTEYGTVPRNRDTDTIGQPIISTSSSSFPLSSNETILWLQHQDDEGDVWYTRADGTGESVWEVPADAKVIPFTEWYSSGNYDA